MLPRSGHHTKMMTPDLAFIRFIMAFPQNFKFITVNAPSWMHTAWSATAKLLPAASAKNYIFDAGTQELSKHLSPPNMLPSWGGTFDFDVQNYMQWLLNEEDDAA